MLIMVRGIVVASLLLCHSSAHSFNVSSPEALVTYLKSFPSFVGFFVWFLSEELEFKSVFRIQVDWGSDRMWSVLFSTPNPFSVWDHVLCSRSNWLDLFWAEGVSADPPLPTAGPSLPRVCCSTFADPELVLPLCQVVQVGKIFLQSVWIEFSK